MRPHACASLQTFLIREMRLQFLFACAEAALVRLRRYAGWLWGYVGSVARRNATFTHAPILS